MEYILKRLGFYLIALVFAVTLNFYLPRLMPGGPVDTELGKMAQSGTTITPELRAAVEADLGYDVTYFEYVGNLFKGDWGKSSSQGKLPVTQVVQRGLSFTVFLMGLALIFSFIINTTLGILAAWRRGTWIDSFFTIGGQFLANIPAVITALLLMFYLCRTGYFPTGYAITPGTNYENIGDLLFNKDTVGDLFYHAAIPLTAILLGSLSGIMGMRANMINQLGDDYIVMGKAKGLPETKIMLSYGARNALLPVVTSLAMQIGFMLGGSLIIEQIFNYPGLGKTMVAAVNQRDYFLMQGILLMTTLLMLCANFLADVAILFLDPRTRR